MKTLIIPDIHNQFGLAETIIEKEAPDEIIFLGDYFDSYDNGPEIAHQTAEWLKDSMRKPNRIHLLGNHDLSYANPGKHMCSGYESVKKHAIDKVGIVFDQLWQFVWVGDWLLTHSGLSNEFYKAYSKYGEDVHTFLSRMCSDDILRETLYSVSAFRGGNDEHAGILWCDWREFDSIPGVKQLFGHTVGDIVRHRDNKNNYCIDTGLNHYAIYEHDDNDGKMIIKSI